MMIKRLFSFISSSNRKELSSDDAALPDPSELDTDERPVLRFGLLTLGIGFFGFLLWAGFAPLDEGVPGSGVVSVDTKRKTIQHLRGGVVESIEVRDGDRVKAGDVLLKLNDTEIKAQLDITRGQYWTIKAVEARLLAERDGRSQLQFSPDLLKAAEIDPRAAEAMNVQRQLFSARRSALVSELGMLDEGISGLNDQIRGLQSVESGKKAQIVLLEKEASALRGLVEEGFVPRNKLFELERLLADLSGTRGGDLAAIARAQSAINEARLRKLQRQQDYRKETETQMTEVQKEAGALHDKLSALREDFERATLRSPTDGAVVGLEAHTIGGVVRPGERIMEIVPEGDVLVVEAQLPVNLIDKVRVGQLANMHFQIVLGGGAQPSIEGRVSRVSADRITDPRTGVPFYLARIELTAKGEEALRKHKIIPQAGMQADVVVVTGERTMLQYLIGPLLTRISAGMKEL